MLLEKLRELGTTHSVSSAHTNSNHSSDFEVDHFEVEPSEEDRARTRSNAPGLMNASQVSATCYRVRWDGEVCRRWGPSIFLLRTARRNGCADRRKRSLQSRSWRRSQVWNERATKSACARVSSLYSISVGSINGLVSVWNHLGVVWVRKKFHFVYI